MTTIYRFFGTISKNCFGNATKSNINNSKIKNKYKIILKISFTGLGISYGSLNLATITPNNSQNNDLPYNFGGLFRFIRSLKIGLSISVDYYFSMMGLNEKSANYNVMMSRIHQRAANKILEGTLLNGGSYIKLGQGLVSMSHILPKEYITTLKQLQDKCLTRKKDEVLQLFMEDFGKSPDKMFKYFQHEPISAASLAQVFKAKTFDNETVAVKVQYIDLQQRFISDVATIDLLLKIAGIMHPDFNFGWVLDELKDTLKQELDFINEGKNAEKCAQDLKRFKYIHVPKIFWEYTSTRVLVMEFIEGYKINDVTSLRENHFSLSDINNKLFEAFGYQIFQTGFVHADPHPGNIFVRKHNRQTELVVLDHGLYQQISNEDRVALSHMWKAIVLNEHSKMKQYSSMLGVEDYIIFAEILTQSPLQMHNFKLRVKLTKEDLRLMTLFARDRFNVIMTCLRKMPSSLLLVIRNLNTIRAIAHDHGNVIDRYAVLARSATQTAFNEETKTVRKIYRVPLRIYFEIKLFTHKINAWITTLIINTLIRLGLMPNIAVAVTNVN